MSIFGVCQFSLQKKRQSGLELGLLSSRWTAAQYVGTRRTYFYSLTYTIAAAADDDYDDNDNDKHGWL